MTKAQLIAALHDLPSDSQVLFKVPATQLQYQSTKTMPVSPGDLITVNEVEIVEDDGPGEPAFAILVQDIETDLGDAVAEAFAAVIATSSPA